MILTFLSPVACKGSLLPIIDEVFHKDTPQERHATFNQKIPGTEEALHHLNLPGCSTKSLSVTSEKFQLYAPGTGLFCESWMQLRHPSARDAWDFFLAEQVAHYLTTVKWSHYKNQQGLVSFNRIKPLLSLVQYITSITTFSNRETCDVFNDSTRFGQYVNVMLPCRYRFLNDETGLKGDVVNIGAGLCRYCLPLLLKGSVKRLILNDLEILPLLITASFTLDNPHYACAASAKLYIHTGSAETLKLSKKSVQKVYAGYLLKYLSGNQLEKLFFNLDRSLKNKGRIYIEEINSESFFWEWQARSSYNHSAPGLKWPGDCTSLTSRPQHYFEFEDLMPLLNNYSVISAHNHAYTRPYNFYHSMGLVTRYIILSKGYLSENSHSLLEYRTGSIQQFFLEDKLFLMSILERIDKREFLMLTFFCITLCLLTNAAAS